jgi:hypothetical protein
LRVPSIVFPEPGKLGFVVWNDPVEPERTRPLERRWPKERQERLVLLERPVLLPERSSPVLLLERSSPVLLALEARRWSFRRFLH